MLRDARGFAEGELFEADVCIVGGGPAGITAALELGKHNLSVILLESGGEHREPDTQDLYRGSQRMPPLPTYYAMGSRVRVLGGTTQHWGGWCRPLDPIDFKARSWIPRSGWPFDRDHLEPYYLRAAPICEVRSDYPHKDEYSFKACDTLQRAQFGVNAKRFGPAFLPQLKANKTVQLILHGSLTKIILNEEGSRVDSLEAACLASMQRFKIRARRTVLATGGIENARLLLSSNVGNDKDLVGRYFTDHPIFTGGRLVCSPNGRRMVRCSTRLTDELQSDNKLLNAVFLLGGPGRQDAAAARTFTQDPWQQVKDHAVDKALFPPTQRWQSYAQHLLSTRGIFNQRFEVRPESVPNPDSRVTLSDEKDALGMLRVHVDWRLTEQDIRATKATIDMIGRQLGRNSLGRIRIDPEAEVGYSKELYQPGYHHLGATRMHEDPAQGVVDSQCKVHGVSNLYIAGSSVFPTFGYANPTYTIVAMALRLADHLAETISA